MKTKIITAVFFLLTAIPVLHAQSGWVVQSTGTNDPLQGMYFIDANTGWAVSFYEKLLKTTNGGTNWQTVNLSLGTNEQTVFFIDASTGWIGGLNGKIAKSTNGGITWNLQSTPTGNPIQCFKFINANTGFGAGQLGTVIRTTDGGTSWSNIYSLNNNNFISMDVLNKDTLYVCGSNSVIYTTTNSGTNWMLQNSGGAYFYSIKFVNAQTGFVVGAGTDKKTTNGGTSWTNMDGGLGSGIYSSVFFYNAQTGWAAGSHIKCTINGGANWFTEDSITVENYSTVFFSNNLTGWACGGNGIMKKTMTAGILPPAAPTNLNAAAISSYKIGLSWTDNSSFEFYFKIERSLNNSNFTLIDSVLPNTTSYTDSSLAPNTGYFYRVYASNIAGNSGYTNTAYAVTFPGAPGTTTLLYPANNATEINLTPFILWNNVSGAAVYHLQLSVDSLFSSTLINDTTLSNTIYPVPGGVLSYNTKYFWRVRAKNNIGYGPWSSVWNFRTQSLTGIRQYSNSIPNEFKMYNNYPNPFNPETKIKFDIPSAGNGRDRSVQLKIYDILGREVAVLINESLQPGKYEINFNAANLASGIYYYRINAGDYVDVKKMVLVK
jgi:photosystem II stability/assembly factor-like uncharacterized protein